MTLSLGILLCSTSNQYAGADPEGSVGVGPPSAGPKCPFHVSNILINTSVYKTHNENTLFSLRSTSRMNNEDCAVVAEALL